jgi:hypothetical protein
MTEISTSKADIIRALETERDWWRAVIDLAGQNGPLTGNEEIDGNWTFKELLAHIEGWRRLTLARLESAAVGSGAPQQPWPDGMNDETEAGTDEINAWFDEQSRARSLDQVTEGLFAQLDDLEGAIERAPADVLLTPGRAAWVGEAFETLPIGPAVIGYSITHVHQEHAPALEAWLSTRLGQHVELPPTPSNLGFED